MEHIIVTEIGNGYKRLTPESGYILKFRNRYFTEAEVEDTTGWSAVPIN